MTFFLTLLFVFLVFWRPQEWLLPAIFGWPLLDIIAYTATVALMLEGGVARTPFPRTPAIALTFGLFVGAVMSHVAHGYFDGIMWTIPEVFKLCVFLLLLLSVLNSIGRIKVIVVVILIGSLIMAAHGMMQIRTGAGFGGLEPLYFYYAPKDKWITQSQFYGIFGDPNDMGQYLLACIPLAFAFTSRVRFTAFAIGGLIVWALIEGLLTTSSRGAMMGSIGVALCLLYMTLPARWLPRVAVLTLVGGLVACAIFGPRLLDGSARDRVMFWGSANMYFKTHPLFGGGYGMFGEISGTNRAAHNAFVLCYTELGLFGYWFWFNLLSLGFIGCWRTRLAFKKARDDARVYLRRVAGLAIASMAGFAVAAFFLSRAYIFPMFILFGLLNSIPVVASRYLPEDHPPLVDWRSDVLLGGTFATVASVFYIYVTILLLNR